MRTVTGYVNGKPTWSDNTPSEARSSVIGGSLDYVVPTNSPYLDLKGEPDAMKKMMDARYKALGRGRAA